MVELKGLLLSLWAPTWTQSEEMCHGHSTYSREIRKEQHLKINRKIKNWSQFIQFPGTIWFNLAVWAFLTAHLSWDEETNTRLNCSVYLFMYTDHLSERLVDLRHSNDNKLPWASLVDHVVFTACLGTENDKHATLTWYTRTKFEIYSYSSSMVDAVA